MTNAESEKKVTEPTNQPTATETSPKTKKEKKKKSALREWLDAIVFAVIAATIIRWAFMSAYTIPTSSMEGTQLVGDFLFVSKIAYGPRTPKTILRIPLTENKIWGTNIPSYLTWIQLPITRLWGYTTVKNRDIVVFNYPEEDAPVDMKTHYIKRCVAIAGDKLEIKGGQVYINDKVLTNAPTMQHSYKVYIEREPNDKILRDLDITEFEQDPYDPQPNERLIWTTKDKIEKLKKLKIFAKIELNIRAKGKPDPHGRVFPQSQLFPWNEDNFGPLVIPKKGMTIEMTPENIALYGKTIQRLDWNEKVEIEDKTLKINGKKVDKYTFKQDYYFMMGDNRHNSLDSRFWGFVPEDHVVGQASFTWLSLDYNKTLFGGKIRWGRMFTGIR
jgi:signal peptidase I